MITDQRFLDAYSMIERTAVYFQAASQTELDVCFATMNSKPEDVWRTRQGVMELRNKMNERAKKLLIGWLADRGIGPAAASKQPHEAPQQTQGDDSAATTTTRAAQKRTALRRQRHFHGGP
jgi:hypothetical protein